jgi:hypothetical protein
MKDLYARIEELVEVVRDRLGTDDPGPETHDPGEIASYWIVRYLESRGYTYSVGTLAIKPSIKLAERGWFRKWRVPNMIDPNRRPPKPKADPLRDDPVAMIARRNYIDETRVYTPEELINALISMVGRKNRRWEPDPAAIPADPKELYEHLLRIAPALQTRRWFVEDRELENWGMSPREYMEISLPGYIRTEYWQNVKTGEGLWVFTAFRTRRRESDRAVVSYVWDKVAALEKIVEDLFDPFPDGIKPYEDAEISNAVEELCFIRNMSISEKYTS